MKTHEGPRHDPGNKRLTPATPMRSDLRARQLVTIGTAIRNLAAALEDPRQTARARREAIGMLKRYAHDLEEHSKAKERPKALGQVEYQGTTDFGEGDAFRDAATFLGPIDDDAPVLALDLNPETWNDLGQPRRVELLAIVDEAAGYGEARTPEHR